MVEWPLPQSVKKLRGFLGLAGYYWQFVANYGTIVALLTCLTKENGFQWLEEATRASETLKTTMVILLVLALPYFYLPSKLKRMLQDQIRGYFVSK